MDARLIAWARRVKALGRHQGRPPWPVLWLFTDADRLPDPRSAVRRLPVGLCGVVLRHDADPDRARLGRDLAQACAARRNLLVVAGDPRLAARLGAGLHLRGGRHALPPPPAGRLITSSAHSLPELRRAQRAGAGLIFLSPVFTTASHPGAPVLGARRWAALGRHATVPVCALGGMTGANCRGLPGWAAGIGAIGAWTVAYAD